MLSSNLLNLGSHRFTDSREVLFVLAFHLGDGLFRCEQLGSQHRAHIGILLGVASLGASNQCSGFGDLEFKSSALSLKIVDHR